MEENLKMLDDKMGYILRDFEPSDPVEACEKKLKLLGEMSEIRTRLTRSVDEKADKEKDRKIRVGQILLEVGIPSILYAITFAVGLNFEKEGVYTSPTFKNLLNKVNPFKKKL